MMNFLLKQDKDLDLLAVNLVIFCVPPCFLPCSMPSGDLDHIIPENQGVRCFWLWDPLEKPVGKATLV